MIKQREVTSEELKKIGIDILKYVDRICRENNINYFLAFGSLLGAVRHRGYIPWDDDIDICMLRSDYDRFRSIMIHKNEYNFIDLSTNNDYYFLFGRVSDKKTRLVLPHKPEIHNLGVFIDVFPIDNAPSVEERSRWYNEYLVLRRKMLATVPSTARYQKWGLKTTYRFLKRLPSRFKYKPIKYKDYCQEIISLVSKYNTYNSEQVVVFDTPYGLKTIMDREIFNSIIELEFEGNRFYAPKDYDAYLKTLYGDYMQLPPVEKRISSHGFKAYWI